MRTLVEVSSLQPGLPMNRHDFDGRDLGYGDLNDLQRREDLRREGPRRSAKAELRRGLDPRLWGPSHFPHPTSSGQTFSNGVSFGGDSSYGIGTGSGSNVGSDLGFAFRGADRPAVEDTYGGHDFDESWNTPHHHAWHHERRYPSGPKGYLRSDERIREDVCERLHLHHELDSSDVEVAVADGIVTLTGTAPNRRTRLHLEQVADKVLGVRDIVNDVKVARR